MSSLSAALDIAGSGLAAVNAQLSLVSQNIANASTPGYVTETLAQNDRTADGYGEGVVTGIATRSLDTQLQQDLFAQNATVRGLSTTQTALQGVDAAQGTVADGNDLDSLLANLQSSFTALDADPSSQVQQSQVVSTASTLAGRINALAGSYTTARQGAQDGLVANVATLNTSLAAIGKLSDQIVALRQRNQSTADLESQRDAALQTVSSLVGVKYLEQPSGDLVITTTGGLTLPTHATNPFSIAGAVIGPNDAKQLGDVPGILLGGTDVTSRLTGGSIGAQVTLRDTTLPTYQGELDEFSQTLSTRFQQQGQALFPGTTGTVPVATGSPPQAGYVGYAQTIQVNPAVQANAALVRDGTDSIAGSPAGATGFAPNTDPGQTGFATLIQRVLNYSFGADVQGGVTQPSPASAGLGPAGALTSPAGTVTTLGDAASTLVGSQSQDIANATTALGNEQAVQTTLATKFSATSAVNTDTELATMVQLQASYGANAKIFTAVQSMFSTLLAAVV